MSGKFTVVALLAGVVVVTGCKKASEKMTEKAIEKAIARESGGKAKVDVQEGKVTIKSEDGTFEVASGGGAKIPDEFPKDVFLMKDAKVTMAMKAPDGMQVMLSTPRSVQQAGKLYADEMKAQGWQEESSYDMGETIVNSYKKDGRKASIVITKDGTGATVQVMAEVK